MCVAKLADSRGARRFPAGRFSLAQPVCAALLACSGPPRLGEGVAAPSVPALLGLQRTGAAGLEKAGGGDGLRMG